MPQDAPVAAPSPHVRKKRERRREEILRAALRAFREKGYHGTSLGDIAGRLGLRKTAIYHYFADKEVLLYECHRRSLSELERAMAEARAEFDRPREQLGHLIREHVRIMVETLEGSTLGFEVPALSAAHQREVVARRDRYERSLRGIIARGAELGEFRPVDPKIAAFTILGAINWISRWYRPEGEFRPHELAARFAAHLVGGLTCDREPRGTNADS